MSRGLAVLGVAIVLFGTRDPVGAQTIPVALLPTPGSQVRAEYRAPRDPVRVEGMLLSGTPTGIMLDTDGEQREIPADLIVGLEVSNGRSRGRGFLVGLGSGLAIGALAVGIYTATTYDETDSCFIVCSRGGAFTLGVAVGATIGAPAGGLIGLVAAPRRWERVW
jgi:hypothetical protein